MSTYTDTQQPLLSGRVKWFNNKAGYGFITCSTDGDFKDHDIFVHHTSLVVGNQQYRYLVQGEYVEMQLVPVENSTHKYQASNVKGINGGLLMCETRREVRANKMNKSDSSVPAISSSVAEAKASDDKFKTPPATPSVAEPKPRSAKVRGSGPREGGDWTVVGKDKKEGTAPPARRGRPSKVASASASATA